MSLAAPVPFFSVQGKPTHHAVKADESGAMAINGKAHGNKPTIEELVAYLGQKRPGWPVPLDKPVFPDGDGGQSEQVS